MDATIQRIYEDNKKLTEKQASVEYFVGLTQNQHKAEQYTALQDQITDLKAEKEAVTPKS